MGRFLPWQLVALALLAAAAVLAGAAFASSGRRARIKSPPCQRFAAPHGSDSNRGTRRSPFATASRLAQALRPGQTGCLLSGRYLGDLHLRQAGARGARLTLRAAPGASATICGFTIFLPGAAYWRLTRLQIDGSCSSQNTIQIAADHARLDHDELTNRQLAQSCVIIGNPSGSHPQGVLIDHDRIHDCGRRSSPFEHGVYASSSRGARISDNYVYESGGFGIHLYSDAQSTLVERNVVVRSLTESGLVFGGSPTAASSHNLVRHNIFTGNGRWGATSSWEGPVGVGNVLSGNCFSNNPAGAFPSTRVGFSPQRNLGADPRFVDPASGNYRLLPGSRCRQMQPRGHVGP